MKQLAILAGAAALLLASCSGQNGAETEAESERYVQAHTIQELMADVVQPTAEIYWGSAGFINDENGETDLTPTTDEGWLAARTSAATLTELGNLLMTPPFSDGRGDDWIEFSQALVKVGQQAEQAAVDRDGEAVFEIGGTVYNICSACHQFYPPKNPPEAGAAFDGEDSNVRPGD